ncbi:MAG: dNTP triphosphohydrolase [Bacteroidaceae bacterium]|nr:dNTP triphosphohydrolase [Bacteroidaceae bacterium]
MNWQQLLSTKRLGAERYHGLAHEERTEFHRDFDRIIFSSAFRRLQNKTQVFPLPGSVFVHNRLTHSLEVSCVGRSLGTDISRRLIEKHPELTNSLLNESGSIVSAACLAHDMGNTPFGHSGEKAIATYFSEGDGLKYKDSMSEEEWQDLVRYDGNANSFRLLTHHFKGRREGGFALTYPTLASIVKYPYPSSMAVTKQKFGYFQADKQLYEIIADELGLEKYPDKPFMRMRHPFVFLVEAADDICYEIMDIEDAHKLKILDTQETLDLLLGFFDTKNQNKYKETVNNISDNNEKVAYMRSCVIGELEKACVDLFVENEEKILNGEFESSLILNLTGVMYEGYKRCEDVSYKKIYINREVSGIELTGYKIITTLIDLYIDAAMTPEKAYSKLLLHGVSSQYNLLEGTTYEKILSVLDFISGMTDIYALDFFRKITGKT